MPWNTHEVEADPVDHPWDDDEAGVCPHCGSQNDPFYEYCKNCIGQLPVPRNG